MFAPQDLVSMEDCAINIHKMVPLHILVFVQVVLQELLVMFKSIHALQRLV